MVGYAAEGTMTCFVIVPAPCDSDPNGKVTSPAVMLSPNARKRVFDSCASFETVTLNEHSPLRFRESVAVHFTSVVPIGNISPDEGEHSTLTEPWPSFTGGVSKLTANADPTAQYFTKLIKMN